MKEIATSKNAGYFFAGLLLHVLCAWFSAGFYHADEHFQILEFSSYKMGNLPASELNWEYLAHIRAAILPGIVYVLSKFMYLIGAYNPFTLAFLLRLFTGISIWYITCRLCILFLPKIKTPEGQKLLILMSLFLWYIPYLNVRFTSENVSGILFLYGVFMLMNALSKEKNSFAAFLFTGVFFGFACFIRIQLLFAVAGFITCLLIQKKINWKAISIVVFAFGTAIGINTVIDFLFYGEWFCTPYNYFFSNIIQHKAAYYGVEPWWFYIAEFLIKAIPPLSIILLIMFFAGIYKNIKNPIVWAIIPFVLTHFLIGHKELRFLFSMNFIYIYICALGLDYLLTTKWYLQAHRFIYRLCLVICIPFLLYRTIAPAQTSIGYCKYLYNKAIGTNPTLFIVKNSADYNMLGLNASFYKNPSLISVSIDSIGQMGTYLNANKLDSAYYLDKTKVNFTGEIPGYKKEKVYCYFPEWILKYNINKWEERTQIWSIYKFTRI